jgi:hypothetical protein
MPMEGSHVLHGGLERLAKLRSKRRRGLGYLLGRHTKGSFVPVETFGTGLHLGPSLFPDIPDKSLHPSGEALLVFGGILFLRTFKKFHDVTFLW